MNKIITSFREFFSRLWNAPAEEWEGKPWSDEEMERRVCEILIRDSRGWAYLPSDPVRERYEAECG